MATERQNAIQAMVEQVLEKRARGDILKIEQENFKQLKEGAKKFLESVKFNSAILSHKNLVTRMVQVKEFNETLYGNMRSSSSYTQNILVAQHSFEEELNKFLKRDIYLTYVGEKGELTAYSEVALKKAYQKATGNLGRGNISEKTLKSITDSDTEIKLINAELRKSASKRSSVYRKALERWESNDNEKEKNYNPSEKTFYWRNGVSRILGWTDRINTRGVIAEGYAEAVINNRNDVLDSYLEESLKALWGYIQKDSIPAAIKGDIVLESNNNIQFAIKQGNFSSAKIGQYINLAYHLSQLSVDIARQDLIVVLPRLLSLSQVAQEIVDVINDKKEKAISDVIRLSMTGVSFKNKKLWETKKGLMGIK